MAHTRTPISASTILACASTKNNSSTPRSTYIIAISSNVLIFITGRSFGVANPYHTLFIIDVAFDVVFVRFVTVSEYSL